MHSGHHSEIAKFSYTRAWSVSYSVCPLWFAVAEREAARSVSIDQDVAAAPADESELENGTDTIMYTINIKF